MLPSGTDGAAGTDNKWEEANQGVTWEAYGPRPQIPQGYTLNEGANYIPFDICLPSGELKPAKYIKLEYREDPLVYSMIDEDPHQYVESFQATPFPSTRCYDRTSLHHADTLDCIVYYLSPPYTKAHVRYDLADCPLYDTILRIARCTISISEPQIL